MNIAELVELLEDLKLDQSELDDLTEKLVTDGVTESIRRQLLAVFVRELGAKHELTSRYEQALDLMAERDAKLGEISHTTTQALNRLEQQTTAQFSKLERHVDEDVEASKGGATLLLHTDDVTPTDQPQVTAPSVTAPVDLSPKQAAATAIAAAKASPITPVSPVDAPIYAQPTNFPQLPGSQPLPPTMTPLPPTPIVPPVPAQSSLAQPSALQPISAPPAMTVPTGS